MLGFRVCVRVSDFGFRVSGMFWSFGYIFRGFRVCDGVSDKYRGSSRDNASLRSGTQRSEASSTRRSTPDSSFRVSDFGF